jgi:uridine phosphorylase
MSFSLDHLQCAPGDLAPVILMPSNPAKADRIATMFDNARNIGRYREFVSWTGRWNGLPVSTVSTGIGCPSTAIAVEEVIRGGGKVLIRVGTCGGAWRPDIPCGNLIIPSACIREEGTTIEYLPPSFPAVADIDVVAALRSVANEKAYPAVVGINRTHDAYYGSSKSRERWAQALQSARVDMHNQPIVSSEMECAALFLLASLRGIRSGAVLGVNAPPEPLWMTENANYTPVMSSGDGPAHDAEARSINLVLEALPRLTALLPQPSLA